MSLLPYPAMTLLGAGGRVTVRAHAKLNLYLRLGARREDGYHDLSTVFQTIALHDTLEFTPEQGRPGLQLRTTHPDVPDGADNLIQRAWRLLFDRFGERIPQPGIACRVDKQIPLMAGLGGGSADAAGALVALNQCWDLELDRQTLSTLALELGSDVPFPLLGGTALGGGRGEVLTPLPDLGEHHLLLLIPPVGVSTKAAFAWWDEAHPAPEPLPTLAELERLWAQAIRQGEWPTFLHNDFEAVVCHHVPVIRQVRDALRARVPAWLTGSGSALVGLCPDAATALQLAERWQPVAGERCLVTRTVTGPGIVLST